MAKDYFELYTDYLISGNALATAIGLSTMTNGAVSHDQITRFLSEGEFDSRQLCKQVKPVVREVQSDDTVVEKRWTD